MVWMRKKQPVFQCNISALKFSDQERQFLREIFLACKKTESLKTGWIVSSIFAKKLGINSNHLKAIVRHCEQKGGVRVVVAVPGRYDAARKYELSQSLFDALKLHYKARRLTKRPQV